MIPARKCNSAHSTPLRASLHSGLRQSGIPLIAFRDEWGHPMGGIPAVYKSACKNVYVSYMIQLSMMITLMPLLEQKRAKPPKEILSVRLDPEVIKRLDLYCRFLGSGRQHVVENSLAYIFDKDKDFNEWLTRQRSKTSHPG